MAVNLDAAAIRQGALGALAVSVPCALLAQVVRDPDDPSTRGGALLFLGVVALVAIGAGAFVAARRQREGTPLAHGLLTALVALAGVTLVSLVARLVSGTGLTGGGFVANLLLTLVAGAAGGLLGGRSAARTAREGP